MLTQTWRRPIGAVLMVLLVASATQAQQVQVDTPFSNQGDSFFEQVGIGFGGRGNNFFFNNGGGGGNNGGGANFGFGIRGNGFSGNLNIFGDTGYNASSSSMSPSVTVQNGGTGAIFSGQQRPFVTGFVPLVGAFSPGVGYTQMQPRYTSPLVERLARIQEHHAQAPPQNDDAPPVRIAAEAAPAPARSVASSAERGEQSMSAIRAQNQAAAAVRLAEVEELIAAAQRREAAGQPVQALLDYQRAVKRADGELKQKIQAKIAELKAKR